jgi:hypothetical protein
MARSKLDAQLKQLLQISNEMLALAKDEAWDDFERKCTEYQLITASLPEIPWAEYNATAREEIACHLRAIEQLHQQILPLAQEWHAELKGLLHNQIQSRRLDEKYR